MQVSPYSQMAKTQEFVIIQILFVKGMKSMTYDLPILKSCYYDFVSLTPIVLYIV